MPDSPSPAFLPRCLIRLVDAAGRFPRLVLSLSILLAVVSAIAFYSRLEYRTQRSDLMSPDKDYQRRWSQYLSEFGDDDDMVVVVEGADRARMRAAIDALAADARQRPEHFDRVFEKVDLTGLRRRALLFLPPAQIQSIHENLRRMGPLLNGAIGPIAWRNLTLVNLLKQARARAGQIDPSIPLSAADEQFLTQLLAVVRAASAALTNPAGYVNPWSSLMPHSGSAADLLAAPNYFFSGDGTLAYLLVRPVKDANSFTPALASVRAMRDLVAGRRSEFADLQIGLTGLPVLESDEMESSQADTNRAGWLALGGVALLYLLVYRCLRHPLLAVSTLLAGTLWSMGWLTITVGHLNILSACFAVMLIGMGDYGVLWVTHYEDERRRGLDVASASRATATAVGPGILTAACSTALAFFAAMLADFQAVAELGWIAGCGVLLCALATFTVLPALNAVFDRRGRLAGTLGVVTTGGEHRPSPVRTGTAETRAEVWLPVLNARPRWVIAAGLAACLLAGFGAAQVHYDHNLLNLQSGDLESVRWERKLLDRSSGASWCALSHVATREEALALKSRYEELPEVSRVIEIASLVPADQPAKLETVRAIRHCLAGLPPRGAVIDPVSCSATDLRREIGFLIGSLEPQAPVSPQPILEQLLRSLSELRDHSSFASAASVQDSLTRFGRRLSGDLLTDLHRLRDVAEPEPIALADLPANLRERYIGQSGRWLVQAYARDGLWEIGPLEQFVRATRTVDAEATGKPYGTLEGLRSMQHGFAWAGAYALAVIVIVLAFDFRTLRHTLLALAPLAAGSLLTLGTMGFLGVALNPANMIALPLIVGVGVDNGVHVLHDYLAHRGRGRYALARTTGIGIAVAALTTILGFGTLMTATHRGLVSLGLVLALGVAFCMVAALVLLPAALRLRQPEVEVEELRRRAA